MGGQTDSSEIESKIDREIERLASVENQSNKYSTKFLQAQRNLSTPVPFLREAFVLLMGL